MQNYTIALVLIVVIALSSILLFNFQPSTKTQITVTTTQTPTIISPKTQTIQSPLTTTTQTIQQPTISIVFRPSGAYIIEDPFNITWKITGGSQITHTEIHWDYDKKSKVEDYKFFGNVLNGTSNQIFSSNFSAPTAGLVYFRIHAVVDGKEYSADEFTITIKARGSSAGGGGGSSGGGGGGGGGGGY